SFFFQAEDGIRDFHVTGVQTCALPIWSPKWYRNEPPPVLSSSGQPVVCCTRPGWCFSAGICHSSFRPMPNFCGSAASHRLWRARSEERRVGKEGRAEREQEEYQESGAG